MGSAAVLTGAAGGRTHGASAPERGRGTGLLNSRSAERHLRAAGEGRVVQLDLGELRSRGNVVDELALHGATRVELLQEAVSSVAEVDGGARIRRELTALSVVRL